MPRVIFSISYAIKEDMRDDYLETIQALKNYLVHEHGKDYSVYEIHGKKNQFSEVYVCKTMEEYDQLEDDADDVTDQLINRIVDDFIDGGKISYSTLIESVE